MNKRFMILIIEGLLDMVKQQRATARMINHLDRDINSDSGRRWNNKHDHALYTAKVSRDRDNACLRGKFLRNCEFFS
ncbi:MAG: hypothetical protein ABIJ30_01160 [bacterium]